MRDAELEQKFLDFVFTTDADITPAALAFYARCPIAEASALLDRLATEGTVRLETDEDGHLQYIFPNRRKMAAPPVAAPPPEPRRLLVPATPVHPVRSYPVSPGAAAALSLLWPGAGQIYAGRVGAGLMWMLFTAIGYWFLFFPGLFLHFFCVVSAAGSAARANRLPA